MDEARRTALLAALRQALGADALRTGEAIGERHLSDWSGAPPVRPLALLRPASSAEVAAALAIAAEHRVPVVPQGGLTGLAGAAVPLPGSLALSLERMNAIEPVDAAAATLTAQAGATLAAVQDAAAARGLMFGVDFGARDSCQIGGALATNAGGNGVLQFGMMREQVLGLEVVLPGGTVLPMLRPMLKNNTGYDLKQLFIGAEGTLGVITRAVLRLRPAPRARVAALVALPNFDAALALLALLQASLPGALAAFELMWADFVDASLRWQQLRPPFAEPHPLLALVEVAGGDAAALQEALEAALAGAMQAGHARDAVIAQTQQQARAVEAARSHGRAADADATADQLRRQPADGADRPLCRAMPRRAGGALARAPHRVLWPRRRQQPAPVDRWRQRWRATGRGRVRGLRHGGRVRRQRFGRARHRQPQEGGAASLAHARRAGGHAGDQAGARSAEPDEPGADL